MSHQVNIPSIDLAQFTSGTPAERAAFVQQLGEAYEQVGFVAVKNHGLSASDEALLYEQVEKFFNLPLELKQQYEFPGINRQRGYTSFGTEHAKGRNEGDLKEFWHFGQYVSDGEQGLGYPDNVEVAELEQFNAIGKKVYQTLEHTGREMLRAIALFLDLDENWFDQHIHNGNSILRPIHYPPITAEPKSAVRAAEHEDINLITVLMGASADGLQVLNKQQEWVPVTALPEQVVVNVGDMLERLTNNQLKSTTHRVVNPKREDWGKSRFSIPFFLHPRSDMPLNCLEHCISDEHPKSYDDILAGDFLIQRLREIGLMKA